MARGNPATLKENLVQSIPLEVVYGAAKFRRERRDFRGNAFSCIDAITYTLAGSPGHTFVSSEEFAGLPGVEVV